MSERFYLGAYWGPRRERVDQCARRLARCLAGLGRHSEILAAWCLKADRTSAMESPVSMDEGELARLLRSGENRRDVNAAPIPELGFSAGLWNGDFERSVGLSTKCGAWSSAVPNSFVLNLPPAEQGAIGLHEPETAKAILGVVIEAWEPEWATWTSHYLREVQDAVVGTPVLGWATYLSFRMGIPDEGIPSDVEIEPLGPGVLVTIGESPRHVSESALLTTRSFLRAALEP